MPPLTQPAAAAGFPKSRRTGGGLSLLAASSCGAYATRSRRILPGCTHDNVRRGWAVALRRALHGSGASRFTPPNPWPVRAP
jgi:hypothetical protein